MREKEGVTEWECWREYMCVCAAEKKQKMKERGRATVKYGELWKTNEWWGLMG